MTLKFNPPRQAGRYALYLEGAGSKTGFRTYDELGHAKNAYNFRGHRYAGKILENVSGEWYVLYDIAKGLTYKELPWVKETQSGYWSSYGKRTTSVPMTRDEYAEWRLQVERERIENKFDISLANV